MGHAVIITGTLILMAVIVCLIKQNIREKVAAWFSEKSYRIWFLPLMFLAYYSILTLSVNQWQLDLFFGLALYFGFPTLILFLRGRDSGPANFFDFLIVLSLWLPVELRLIQKGWVMVSVGEHSLKYPLSVFTAVVYALIVFTGWRKIKLKCDWSLKLSDWKRIGLVFLIIAAIIIPIAASIGFVKFGIAKVVYEYYWALPLVLGLFFFAPAFPEELIFRGLIQGLINTRTKTIVALILGSLIFGFAHINNSVDEFKPPNFTYICFATIAGLGYGYVYLRSKSLVASAILHALVDFIWMITMRGGG